MSLLHAPRGAFLSGIETFAAISSAAGIFAMSTRVANNGTLTRAALVEQVAHAAGLAKKRAEVIVDALFGSIAEALRQGEKVELRGFGSFRLRRRGPHSARNPRTGDRVDVPSKRVAYFKPGKELKELINREPEQAGPATSPATMPDAGPPLSS